MKKIISIITLLTLTVSVMAQNLSELKEGAKIAEFSGLDDTGTIWKSTTIKSDFIVVYFYPAAMTGGCTKQACAYRDNKASFDEMDVTVIGVSGDEVKNLKHFKETYQLNFPLLSDNEGSISKTFGVPTSEGGSIIREIDGENYLLLRGITTPRWTFILDKDRKIIYKNSQVNAVDDSKEVLKIIKKYVEN